MNLKGIEMMGGRNDEEGEVEGYKCVIGLCSQLAVRLLPYNNMMEGIALFEQNEPYQQQILQNGKSTGQSGAMCGQRAGQDRPQKFLSGPSGDLQNKLRKYINHYLYSICGQQQPTVNKNVESAVQTLIGLIGGNLCAQQGVNNRKNLSYSGFIQSTKINYSKTKKTDQLRIAIIDPLQRQGRSKPSALRIAVIDYYGNIEQYRPQITSSVDLGACLARIQRKSSNLVVAIRKVEDQVEWQHKMKVKLQRWLRGYEWQEGEWVGGDSAGFGIYRRIRNRQGKQVSSYNNFRKQDYNQALVRFYLIRNLLDHNALQLAHAGQEFVLSLLFPFAYNIISQFVSSETTESILHSMPWMSWLQPFLRQVGRQWQNNKIENIDGHYPTSLNNAQVCWRCKTRGFICCQTCSYQQGKKISLCLQCYGPHHQQLTKVTQKQVMKDRLGRWQKMDEQVQAIMGQEQLSLMAAWVGIAKKQQQE